MDAVRKLIKERLDELGLTKKEVSLRIGRSHSYLQQFLTRGVPAELGENERGALSQILGVDEQLLRGPSAPLLPKMYAQSVAPRRNNVSELSREAYKGVPEQELLVESNIGPSDLPVYGTSFGEGGEIMLSGNAVQWVARPPALDRVVGAYAVIVPRSKMEPVVKIGSIVLFHPHLPPRMSDLCLFRSLREGVTHVIGAEYRGETDDAWKAYHYTPARSFILKKSEWPVCHRAVGAYFP